jgi:hypothetical protein
METFKDRVYHYEATPPENTWDDIADKLYNEKAIKLYSHGKTRLLFYGITAAASVIIIFLGSLFFKTNKTSFTDSQTPFNKSNKISAQVIKDSIRINQKILNSIINDPVEKKEIVSSNFDLNKALKKYLTIKGPTGQPVKISPKVATLILSADNEYPPKPIWSNKISKWQKIMLNTTLSPTSASFLDIITMASNNNME